MAIRAISFDLFDTLVDLLTEKIPTEEYRGRSLPKMFVRLHAMIAEESPVAFDEYLRVMKEVDGEFRESHYARNRELPSLERFQAVIDRLGIHAPGLADSLVSAHMGGLAAQVRILDHHRAVLSELKKSSRLAVCSNFSHSETAHRVLADAGLDDLMDAVLISDAVGIRKPAPEIFRATLDALGVEAEEMLHVGDRLGADVAGAAALGIRTVWIVRRVDDPAAALAAHPEPAPDFQVSDLDELPGLVSSLSRPS
jgi:FMN phosphatase YigB (HAD superfamily)